MPNSKPALDVPIIFPYAPNAVLIGFFVSFIVGTISMLAMVGLNTTVIIPGVVGHFSVVPRQVFWKFHRGRRGAILGAAFNGLLISWLPLFILPVLGDLQLASSTFADTDYLIPGLFLGKLGEAGPSLLVGGIIAFVVVVLLASAVLTMREKKSPKKTKCFVLKGKWDRSRFDFCPICLYHCSWINCAICFRACRPSGKYCFIAKTCCMPGTNRQVSCGRGPNCFKIGDRKGKNFMCAAHEKVAEILIIKGQAI